MNKLIGEPIEIVLPRRWWQFKSKPVLPGRWYIESQSYDLRDGITIVLRDQMSVLNRYKSNF